MAQQLPEEQTVEDFTLQYYINLIPRDAEKAAKGLSEFKHPLAKVFLAYMYLNGDVSIDNKSTEINALMYKASQQLFKKYRGKTRYDFSMKYAYEDIDQLLLHLKAMYEVVKDRPDVPCWLFERHARATAKAFAPYWNNNRDTYTISTDCGSFLGSDAMKILLTISKEFASDERPVKNVGSTNQLYIAPQPLSYQEMEQLEKWNGKLWKNLKTWSEGSPLQSNMYNLLRFSYYDVLQQMEQRFIKKGLPGIEARSLSLKILKVTVGCNLDEYCGKE
ncbi:MAG: hypothetical protein GY810_07575 [Aureispira sp.]|nr:hypothetical protein [Aureispira sp.]